jgi:hypothetical protein
MFENPRKTITISVIILIALGIVFYLVWGIYLNKGTVVFKAVPPFTVSIGEYQKTCGQPECEFWIPARDYDYIVTKPGYYEDIGSIKVERAETYQIEPELYYVTEVLESNDYNIFSLPKGYGNYTSRLLDITLFNDFGEKYTLKRLPKIIENIRFSPSGEMALVFEGNLVSLYNTRDFSVSEITRIENAVDASWNQDESAFYTIEFDEDLNREVLIKYNLANLESGNLIYFLREIIEYDLKSSPGEKFVAVADKTFRPEILYLINLGEDTRNNVFEGYTITRGKWSADGGVYVFSAKAADETLPSLWVLNTEDNTVNRLPFYTEIHNLDFYNGNAYFVTDQPYSISATDIPYTSTFEDKQMQRAATPDAQLLNEQREISLHRWSYEDNRVYFLKDLTQQLSGLPIKAEVGPEGKIIRVLIDGKYYDIRISE